MRDFWGMGVFGGWGFLGDEGFWRMGFLGDGVFGCKNG